MLCVFGQRAPAKRRSRAKPRWRGEDSFLKDQNGESQASAAGSPGRAGQAAWPRLIRGVLNATSALRMALRNLYRHAWNRCVKQPGCSTVEMDFWGYIKDIKEQAGIPDHTLFF